MRIWIFCLLLALPNWLFAKALMQITSVSEADIPDQTIELIKRAYNEHGFEPQIHYMPALRALRQAEHSQEFDAVLLREPQAENHLSQHIKIDVPLKRLFHVAYSTRANMEISDWQSLHRYRVVCVRGFISINQALAKHPQKEIVTSSHQAMRMLELGRVDLAILPDVFGRYEIEQHGHTQVKAVAISGQTYLYHFLHKDYRDLAPALTESLTQQLEHYP